MKKIITLCLMALLAVSLNSCASKSPVSTIKKLLTEASERVEKAQSMQDIEVINQEISEKFLELQEKYKDYVMTEEEIAELNPAYEKCGAAYEKKITELSTNEIKMEQESPDSDSTRSE